MRETNETGDTPYAREEAEYDALGNNVGLSNPYVPSYTEPTNEGAIDFGGAGYNGGSSLYNGIPGGRQYTVDGIGVSEAYFMMQIDSVMVGGAFGLLAMSARMSTRMEFAGYSMRTRNGNETFEGFNYNHAVSRMEGGETLIRNWFVNDSWSLNWSLLSFNERPQTPQDNKGAGGGIAKRSDNTGKKATKARLNERVNKCAKELFGATIKDSDNGVSVSIPGFNDIEVTGSFDLSGAELARQLKKPGEQSGATFGNRPEHVYVATEVYENPVHKSNIGFTGLYYHELGNAMAGLRYKYSQQSNSPDHGKDISWIEDPRWEAIIKKYAGSNYDHVDAGMAFEACVFRGMVGLRTGKIGNSREFRGSQR